MTFAVALSVDIYQNLKEVLTLFVIPDLVFLITEYYSVSLMCLNQAGREDFLHSFSQQVKLFFEPPDIWLHSFWIIHREFVLFAGNTLVDGRSHMLKSLGNAQAVQTFLGDKLVDTGRAEESSPSASPSAMLHFLRMRFSQWNEKEVAFIPRNLFWNFPMWGAQVADQESSFRELLSSLGWKQEERVVDLKPRKKRKLIQQKTDKKRVLLYNK